MHDFPLGQRLTVWQTLRLLWHLPTLLRLLARLLGDAQVQWVPKALFFGAILFILSPLDVPNYVPVLGQMSDAVLALFACRWFLNNCPAELVAGHLAAIRGQAAVRIDGDPARKE
jgi:uncharacterized membrane protein YkvA (DUF1232 family)